MTDLPPLFLYEIGTVSFEMVVKLREAGYLPVEVDDIRKAKLVLPLSSAEVGAVTRSALTAIIGSTTTTQAQFGRDLAKALTKENPK